jgi:hypothetical protein
VKLFEILPGTPGYRRVFEVIPERPFTLPGRGRMELMIGRPGNRDEVVVYDVNGKETDRVAITLVDLNQRHEQN